MVILITIMPFFLIKAIDCVKDVIRLTRWQNLASVTDVKMSSFGKVKYAMIYACVSSMENRIPKENNRPKL